MPVFTLRKIACKFSYNFEVLIYCVFPKMQSNKVPANKMRNRRKTGKQVKKKKKTDLCMAFVPCLILMEYG